MLFVRFDRHELAGALGDMGTVLPLIIALVGTCGLDAASVCILFGLCQIITGLRYGMPMPVQPLKAMAAIMLGQKLAPEVLAGGGLVIGTLMLILASSGTLDWLAQRIPSIAVRGVQLGLAATLCRLAIGSYIVPAGAPGWALAVACAGTLLLLRRQNQVPGPLLVMLLGVGYALVNTAQAPACFDMFAWRLPHWAPPSAAALSQGALALALPQLPLSLANSVLATSQATHDLFPDRAVSVRKIGWTYGLMNSLAPWFGGLPLCHGCGGLTGFYGFGARTGGAPIMYGTVFLAMGLCFSPGFHTVAGLFPLPMLGVILLFEAWGLMALAWRGTKAHKRWHICAMAALVLWLPHGYLWAMLWGCIPSTRPLWIKSNKRGHFHVPNPDGGLGR